MKKRMILLMPLFVIFSMKAMEEDVSSNDIKKNLYNLGSFVSQNVNKNNIKNCNTWRGLTNSFLTSYKHFKFSNYLGITQQKINKKKLDELQNSLKGIIAINQLTIAIGDVGATKLPMCGFVAQIIRIQSKLMPTLIPTLIPILQQYGLDKKMELLDYCLLNASTSIQKIKNQEFVLLEQIEMAQKLKTKLILLSENTNNNSRGLNNNILNNLETSVNLLQNNTINKNCIIKNIPQQYKALMLTKNTQGFVKYQLRRTTDSSWLHEKILKTDNTIETPE